MTDGDAKPLFLQAPPEPEAENPDAKPDGVAWGNWLLSTDPTKPLLPRQREAARLMFLGKTNREICEALGYKPPQVTLLSQNVRVQEEVQRLHDKAFERTVAETLRDLGPKALATLEEGLDSGKLRDRVEAAKWLLEKLDGKAVQKTETRDATLEKFIAVLADLRAQGKTLAGAEGASKQVLDVTPKFEEEPAPAGWGAWLDTNL